jgi:hypothetical protein
LLEVIGSLYGLPVPPHVNEKAREQEEQLTLAADKFLEQQPQLKVILKQLEENYDSRINEKKEQIHLSPEMEKFLKELNGRFDLG